MAGKAECPNCRRVLDIPADHARYIGCIGCGSLYTYDQINNTLIPHKARSGAASAQSSQSVAGQTPPLTDHKTIATPAAWILAVVLAAGLGAGALWLYMNQNPGLSVEDQQARQQLDEIGRNLKAIAQ